jgi:hypothetical protein
VRNRCHARHSFLRVRHLRGRYVHPQSGFEVNGCALSADRDVIDLLHVGDAVQMDVILRHGPTIGNVAEALGKRECFGGKVEFEYVVAVGKRNRQRGRVGIIGAEDGVEAVAGEVSVQGADGRPSTSKFQFWLWTGVLIFSYAAIFSMKVAAGNYDPISEIPKNVLIAMGMSVLSATVAKGITVGYVSSGRITKPAPTPETSGVGAILQDDTGFPDLSKVQMIAWTLIAIVTYLIAVASRIHTNNVQGLPDIDSALMVLMGLGHGAYLGKKLVSQDQAADASVLPTSKAAGAGQ